MDKDDLGLEVDADVASFLKDPKAPVLVKVVRYIRQRDDAQAKLDAEKTEKAKPESKLFGLF